MNCIFSPENVELSYRCILSSIDLGWNMFLLCNNFCKNSVFPRLVKDLLISLIYVYSFFIFFSGWLFNIKFTQTIKSLCNWSLNGMVHVPNDLLSATSQNLENYWNRKEMLVSVIATSLKPLEIKIWNFFKFKCFKLTKRLVQ